MKDIRYFRQGDDYVILYDYAGLKEYPFLVEAKISGHRHEERFASFSQACVAFNAIVLTIQTSDPGEDE